MRDLLAEGMHGFFFLVDAADRASLQPASRLLAQFKQRGNVPYLLVANKADQQGMSSAEIKKYLNLPQEQPVVSCVATDQRSVRAAVEQLVTLIEAGG
jgi:signal recognition particle receptor subunit beta